MAHGDLGETWWDANGPTRILLLNNDACLAARFAAANREGRNRIAAANRNVSISQLYGVGLLIILHEAEHVALRSRDECLVERTAYRKLPTLLRMFAPRLAPVSLMDAASFNRERMDGC